MHGPRSTPIPPIRPTGNDQGDLAANTIQPHGLLLLFDAGSETLAHWAGDCFRLLGVEPSVGQRAAELLGAPLADLIGSRLPVAGEEAVTIGHVDPPDRGRLSLVAGCTGTYIAIELETAGDPSTAIAALEQVRSISSAIGVQTSLADACDSAAALVRAITGYDRLMVYRFLADGSGSVIAEARAPEVQGFIDHRFPGSDLPDLVRDEYRLNIVRVTPDVGYIAADLQPAGGAAAVDMSQFVLRGIAPFYTRYLKAMGVGASLTISLLVDGALWGLIGGHHRSARHVPPEARLLCRHVGTTLAAFIDRFEQAERMRRNAASTAALEEVLRSLRASSDPERTLRASAGQMAQLVDCGGFALLARGTVIAAVGQLPDADRLRKLATLLEVELADRESFATDRLAGTIIGAPQVVAEASGALAVRIEASRPLLALWLKPEAIEEIWWAGNPGENGPPGSGKFATWRETVSGRSRPWAWHEIKLVEVLRGRAEATMQRHRLGQLNQELAVANATLRSLATTDALTGLPNRRLFDGRLKVEWQRAQREDSSIAMVAIDVDHFKKYNDKFGHPAGDECLKQVATAIAEGRRGVDVAARLGGEEFGLLLTDIAAGQAADLAERVRLSVEQLGLDHPLNEAGVVTISMGVAVGTPLEWQECARLVGAADRALYEAKARGRNRVHIAVPSAIGE